MGKPSQTDFPAEEFVGRRARICEALGDAHALIASAGPPRGFVPLRQSNQFFYLAGLETTPAYLLIDGAAGTSALYLPPRERAEIAEGVSPGLEDEELVTALTGVDAVHPVGALVGHLGEAKIVYTPHAPAEVCGGCRTEFELADQAIARDPWDGRLSREQRLIGLLRSRHPGVEVRDLTPILDEMRAVKSPLEVAVMRRAERLSAEAVCAAMRVTRPGVLEYQLGALANYLYAVNGAQGEGYRPIIAGGENIWYGHYFRLRPRADGRGAGVQPLHQRHRADVARRWHLSALAAGPLWIHR